MEKRIDDRMSTCNSRRAFIVVAICLAITLLIGFCVVLLSLDNVERGIVFDVQSFAQKTLGILFFEIVTYLGDLYVWVIIPILFLFYTYFKSRDNLKTAVKLVVYMILVTASTYLLKVAFARPRPNSANIIVYEQEESFSYPSGHVSRAGALIIFSDRKNKVKSTLIAISICLVSLSRIVLGAHYPTDTLGAVFLSLAVSEATEIVVPSLFKHL